MQFELIRLMLVSRAQTSLFEPKTETGTFLNREAWLRRIFSEQIAFTHGSGQYLFIPSIEDFDIDGIISGQICRQFKLKENLPPDEGLIEVEREPWRATDIFIDPTYRAGDGQKLAFQSKDHIGRGVSVIKALCNKINMRRHEPYIIEANAIIDPTTFWEFEQKHRGDITSVTFDFVVPNMFGTPDEMSKEIDDFKKNEKARAVTLTLKNQDGLKLDESRVQEAVKHTTRGGGSIIARLRGRRPPFRSNDNAKKIHIDDDKSIDSSSRIDIFTAIKAAIFGGDNE